MLVTVLIIIAVTWLALLVVAETFSDHKSQTFARATIAIAAIIVLLHVAGVF